jgi:serine/threonine protein kinase
MALTQGQGDLNARSSRKRSPTRPPPPAAEMPQRVGPYRLCMEIGSGGMATVYLARVERSAGIRRFVALKRLRPHLLEQPTLAEMFFDEVDIASQLNHPNVCSVLDFDASPERHYLALEYLVGESLSSVYGALMRAGEQVCVARRIELAARVVAEACEGLHAAHELRDLTGKKLDVVHRDVSPDNIFLTYDGIVKIVDFGVASATGQKHETRAGIVKGKLAYLAPEVLKGQRPDRRADIWALGVVLWEVLTMRRLFRREGDVETLMAVREGKVTPPSRVARDLRPDLDDIVMHALEPDPDRRFASARELGRELQHALVRHGSAVGAAELSDLMDVLFPGGRENKRQLLEAASEIDDGEPANEAYNAVTSGTAELGTGDLSFATPTSARTTRVVRWLAAPAMMLTACFTYGLWPSAAGDDEPRAAATPAEAPEPTRADEALECTAAEVAAPSPKTIVLDQGTYVLEVRGGPMGGAEPQVLRLEVPVSVRAKASPARTGPAPSSVPDQRPPPVEMSAAPSLHLPRQ